MSTSNINFTSLGVGGGMPGSDWIAYTPTFTGFGTPSNISFYYRRVGDSLDIMGKFTAGTNTATEARISLPLSLVTDSSKIPSIRKVGDGAVSIGFAARVYVLAEPSVSYITFSLESGSVSGLTKRNGDDFTNGIDISVAVRNIPISGWTAGASAGNGPYNASFKHGSGTASLTSPNSPGSYGNFGAALSSFSSIVNENMGTISNAASFPGFTFTPPVIGKYEISVDLPIKLSNSAEASEIVLTDGTTNFAFLEYGSSGKSANEQTPVTIHGIYNATSLSSTTIKLIGNVSVGTLSIGAFSSWGAAAMWTIKKIN